jgi:hypothetical protein
VLGVDPCGRLRRAAVVRSLGQSHVFTSFLR